MVFINHTRKHQRGFKRLVTRENKDELIIIVMNKMLHANNMRLEDQHSAYLKNLCKHFPI